MHTIFFSTLSNEREISPSWTKDHGWGIIFGVNGTEVVMEERLLASTGKLAQSFVNKTFKKNVKTALF